MALTHQELFDTVAELNAPAEAAESAASRRRLAAKAAREVLVRFIKPGAPYVAPFVAGEVGSFPPAVAKKLITEGYAQEMD